MQFVVFSQQGKKLIYLVYIFAHFCVKFN